MAYRPGMNAPDDIEIWRKRLTFRSWHRGTKEMDLLMGSFADRHIAGFSAAELAQYEDVLGHNDPDLYSWITGAEKVPANLATPVLGKLLTHRFADQESSGPKRS